MFNFRNDYSQGAHPKVLDALLATNMEGNVGYGDDEHCANAARMIRELCQAPQADVQFFIGGTSTNFTAICAFLRPWEAVISPETGHINGHEAAAVEATGHKIISVPPRPDGKLTPADIDRAVASLEHSHVINPGLVYITNATENGTVYTLAELEAISACCKKHKLLLFLDGARLACALTSVANDITLPDLARLTDAFYIGGTKNGALMGEALVICNPALQDNFFLVKKQRGGVLAKGWLLGAQFEALLTDNLYYDLGRHANEMAARLQDGLKKLGLRLYVESTTNQIFLVVSDAFRCALRSIVHFEDWCPGEGPDEYIIRFVTNFSTTPESVDGLLQAIAELI